MTIPENVPALLTITDFAKRCGVSRATATKIAESHPEYIEKVEGGQKYVKASLLFSFYDKDGCFIELDDPSIKAANCEARCLQKV